MEYDNLKPRYWGCNGGAVTTKTYEKDIYLNIEPISPIEQVFLLESVQNLNELLLINSGGSSYFVLQIKLEIHFKSVII